MMTDKYRVPALYRANDVLTSIAENPNKYSLIDLVEICGSNKSTMFTLLHTMESLSWVNKNKDGTYCLGIYLGKLSASYFKQFNLINVFHNEASSTVNEVNETIQLGILDNRSVFYLAKEESLSLIQLVTNPGGRQPVHTTALGKSLLLNTNFEYFHKLYDGYKFETPTRYSVGNLDQLWNNLESYREKRYTEDLQETVLGFCCVAAPIFNNKNQIIAAISISMTEENWKKKSEISQGLIIDLARRISALAGYMGNFFEN